LPAACPRLPRTDIALADVCRVIPIRKDRFPGFIAFFFKKKKIAFPLGGPMNKLIASL